MTEPRERPAGTLVKGKWRITSVLKSGTAAAVYLAKSRSGSDVALKIVHAHLAADELVRRRLLEEAEVLASLDHPAVVRVLDEDAADDGAALLLLEPLDGETLDRRAARLGGALALEDAFDVADLLLEFLRVAHARGVLHFDITPENLFFTDTGLLKVLDFGALHAPAPSGARTGAPAGRAFTAPELLLDEPSDARSDIWSVGALMYALVTGAPPRAHDAPAHSVASVPVRVLRDSPLELPRAFVNIVDRSLEFDRADRWPDVEAMQQALRWARRSLESGWGGGEANDPLGPRPSRSSLAEQARLARLSATPAPSAVAPATGPTPVEVTVLARLRDEAVAAAAAARGFEKTGADVATPRPEIEEHTLVGARSVVPVDEPPRDEDFRLKPRRASEPTLPSASIVPDSEKTKASHVRPAGGTPPAARPPLDSLIEEASPPPAAEAPAIEAEEPTGQVKAIVATGSLPPPKAPPRRSSIHPPSTPPGSDGEHANDPDTLIRAAPRVSLPAEGEVVAPVQADEEVAAPPPPISEPARASDRMPPTVRIARRADSPARRVLILAAAAGALVGALAFGFWPRSPPPRANAPVDAGALAVLAPSASATPALVVTVDAEASDASTIGDADVDAAELVLDAGASAIATSDASTMDEDDAAAALEARLAEARRRRRERAAAEASAKAEAGPSEADNPYGDAPSAASAAASSKPASSAPSASAAPVEVEVPAPKPHAEPDAGE